MRLQSLFFLIIVISVQHIQADDDDDDFPKLHFEDENFGFDNDDIAAFKEVRDDLEKEGYFKEKASRINPSQWPPDIFLTLDLETTTMHPCRTMPPIYIEDVDGNMYITDPPKTKPKKTAKNIHPSITQPPIYIDVDSNMYITESPIVTTTDVYDNPCNYARKGHPKPKTNSNGRVSERKCEDYAWKYWADVVEAERNTALCNEKLGVDNISGVAGGQIALEGDFPHMGAVGWTNPNKTISFLCGCSLISEKFALTAGHCWSNEGKSPDVVRFGSVYIGSAPSNLFEDIKIKDILVLDEFRNNNKSKYNDIALIELEREVDFSRNIRPACLWSGNLGLDWTANITGWGRISQDGPTSDYLKYATVDYIEKSICRRYIEKRKNRHWKQGLKSHQFCATKMEGGVDTCRGDSGGPLQIRRPMPMGLPGEMHYVVGVTSFGLTCAQVQLPSVYINVTSFLCWIERNVWPEEQNNCKL